MNTRSWSLTRYLGFASPILLPPLFIFVAAVK